MSFAQDPARHVHKFGGASLADGEAIRRVGAILRARVAAGERPIAVVSASEGVTAMLDRVAFAAAAGNADVTPVRIRHRSLLAQLALDAELVDRHLAELATVLRATQARGALASSERDHVLSFGERISARIVAAHLASLGVRAVPVDAFDLGLVTDSNHGRARVLPESRERVRRALEKIDGVPVITGFVAVDPHGRLTTLGRNGSDVTAALIAEAIEAAEACFWKEVAGILSADPRLVPSAHVVPSLSYEDAAEFTRHGASVLHADTVEPLARAGVAARVACTRSPDEPGTLIGRGAAPARAVGLAFRHGLVRARAKFASQDEAHAWLARIRRSCDLAHAACSGTDVTVVAPWCDAFGPIEVERDLASLAAVGRGIDPNAIREELTRSGAEVIETWLADPRGTSLFLLRESELATAARAAHASLFERSQASQVAAARAVDGDPR